MRRFIDSCLPFFGILLFSLLGLGSTALAGLQAVQLETIPTNILVDCNRTFFKSNEKDARVMYVTPHVVAGRAAVDGDRPEVHINTTPQPGKYILNIGVFFPRNGEGSISGYSSRDSHSTVCNYDAVTHYLNKIIDDEDKKYQSTNHLPLTSIEISIPGIRVSPYVIGRIVRGESTEQVDILEYLDNSYTAEFLINDDQLEYINERLVRDEGLQLDIRFRFQSRRKDGSITVDIDGSEVAKNFRAAAAGQKLIAKADLKGTIQSAVTRSNINIDVQAGQTDAFAHIATQIVKKVLDNVDFETNIERVDAEHVGTELKDKALSVSAVAEYLSSQMETHFSFNLSTTASDTTAQTTTRVHSMHPLDPSVVELRLRDSFPPVNTTDFIHAGETVKITPAYRYLVRRRWKEKKTYFSVEQMDHLGIHETFHEITNGKMELKDVEKNGQFYARGVWWGAWVAPMPWHPTYRWRRIQRYPVTAGRVKVERFNVKTEEDLVDVPVSVAFSKINSYNPFTLEELLEENELFEAKFEYGTIVLTAKRDLGTMRLRETNSRPYYKQKDRHGNFLYANSKCPKGRTVYENTNMIANEDGSISLLPVSNDKNTPPLGEGCEFMYNYRVGVINLDEVIQEQYAGWGMGYGKIDSEPMPVMGRIDRHALAMFQVFVMDITRPTIAEDQPSDEELKNKRKASLESYGIFQEYED